MRVAILNTGIGNSMAVNNLFHSVSIPSERIKYPEQFGNQYSHLVISGVGSFDSGITGLKNSGWWELLSDKAFNFPVLGICLGMQMLCKGSEEGSEFGLGVFEGWISRLSPKLGRVPNIGWKSITANQKSELLNNLEEARFYFSHSYALKVNDESQYIVATTNQAEPFAAVIRKDNWYGVQFHPEKSHHFGKKLLHNFSKVT